ncbi:progranulin-like [Archocentrus centrarchus]|uniref:progranulin-like n=1 Tax=Archocentrus centrarchus TaxID=63155 RepID=UPI0011EA3762|nr:progranulin-like [Archocentrus centrarchus]
MSKITLWFSVGAFVLGFACCSITCPDGTVCSDVNTCCKTQDGYGCCHYPNAVCCSDMAHCCPSGYLCNLATQRCEKENQPWLSIPMENKEAAEEPSTPNLSGTPLQELTESHVPDPIKSSVVYCDSYTYCPDGTTCCRHPKGGWFCCLYSPGKCCLDGYHCCPYGYDCDHTYTQCVRERLAYPFLYKPALPSAPASLIPTSEDKGSLKEIPMMALTQASASFPEAQVIHCDSQHYCQQGMSCCKAPTGQWNCCPYPLGQCCADGLHCCEYGYTCDASFLKCRRSYF